MNTTLRLASLGLAAAALAACGGTSIGNALVIHCDTTVSAQGTHSECTNNIRPGTPQPAWMIAK